MSQICSGTFYDATSAILDLDIAHKVKADPDNKYGAWQTKQPWFGRVTYNTTTSEWNVTGNLGTNILFSISDPDVFVLIDKVLAEKGR